ncbi:Adaptive-response sensory-kinase SasA [bioreactor metagenome]|uniref:histidine kinase n=1 Tax=bioreactor metagenome TaxID=1076179 RepID=A0A644ZNT7_9ZZZZ
MALYSESRGAAAAGLIGESGLLPSGGASDWLELSGISIESVGSGEDGFLIPEPFALLLPQATKTARRSIETAGGEALGLKSLDGLSYNIYLTGHEPAYRISIGLGTCLHIFRLAFAVLAAFQVLTLFSSLFKDARMVRTTLEPITRLAETARSLNAVGGQFDPGKMEALAGKLEGINASKLDTRIQVDDTQEELKNLARAINSMLDRINESYRAQVRFVSDASHELRTPISVIQGYANLLDRWGKNDAKTLQESINAIKDEAANMKDLVEQLLFLARGDNNTLTPQFESFSLSDLAAETVHETQMIDSAHNFVTRIEGVTVVADKGLIKQALRILIDNAIKYTDPGGNITVAASEEDGNARLTVSDDGIGISPENLPKIFDRFYRADESRARSTGGAGLGLSIAKWITSRHGGRMEVLSREGIGTRITLVLPSREPEAAGPSKNNGR